MRASQTVSNSLAALTSSHDVDWILGQILDHVATVIPSGGGSSILFESGSVRAGHLRGFSAEAEAFFVNHPFPADDMAYGAVLSNKHPYFIPDTTLAVHWKPLPGSEWIRVVNGNAD